MDLLHRTVVIDGERPTVEAVFERFIPHLCWPVRDLVRTTTHRVPDDAALLAVAARFAHTLTATNLFQAAGWRDLLALLAGAGWTARERFELMLEVRGSARPGGQHPPREAFVAAADALSVDDARALVAATSDDADPLIPLICALPLVRAGEAPPPQLDRAYLIWLPPEEARELLVAAAPDRREATLLRLMDTDASNAAQGVLGHLAFVKDLLDTPALERAVARLREVASDYPGIERVYARFDQPDLSRDADGLTELARKTLDYVEDLRADARKEAGLGAVAEHAALQRLDVAGAPELASLEAWSGATDARREAIADLVLEVIGRKHFKRAGFHGDIALYAHRRKKSVQLALVPGGEVVQGLSEAEEERLRVLAAEAEISDHFEEWGALVEQLPVMRPVRRVSVGPMLIGRGPGERMDARKLMRWLTRGPYRLPTESEWEYAARGGQGSQLTWRGDALPDAAWFRESRALKADAANRFGLWGFGDRAEICADQWRPSYDGAPTDGSPVTGDGPRAIRGGAGELYPWQETGEWHLLLTAMRSSQAGLDEPAARPVIGLRLVAEG